MLLKLINILVEVLQEILKLQPEMNADAKPMFLVNGVSPLPFSSGWTGRMWREMDIQGMVKTQRHQKHSVLIIINSRLSGDQKLWHDTVEVKSMLFANIFPEKSWSGGLQNQKKSGFYVKQRWMKKLEEDRQEWDKCVSSFTVKQSCSILLNDRSSWGLI